MTSFDTFYTSLISDQRWFELLRHYKDSTIKSACEKVFAGLVADGTVEARPMSENRKHVYNILIKNPGDKPVLKNWAAKALEIQEEEKKKEWVPLTGEERAKRIEEYKKAIDSLPMLEHKPRSKEVFYGKQVEKLPPYPITSAKEAYEKDRHIEYLRKSYHPLTREKLPGWLPESEFNRLYDEGLI